MLRNVFTKDIWDRRKAMIWWIVGVAFLAVWITVVYPTIRDSEAFQNFIRDFPPELMAMFGMDPDTYLTGAGFLQAQLFSFVVPIIVLAFAIPAGVAATAREESNGTMDILLSAPISRVSVIAQKAASLILLSAVVVAAIAAVVTVMNPVVDLKLSIEGVVAVSVGVWLLGLVFAGVAMVLGAFTGSPAVAGGVAAGLAIVSWFVNAFSSIYSWLEIPSDFSPFNWYLQDSPLLNGFSSGHLWLLVATVLLIGGSFVVFTRRDVATERAVLPERSRNGDTVKHTKPRRTVLLRSVFGKSLWDRRRSVWIWALGLSTMSLITLAAWPSLAEDSQSLQQLVESFPREVLALFGLTDPAALATPEGFISSRTYGSVGPIVLIVFGIMAMASLVAKEESTGILDLVMSSNQRRRAVMSEKAYAVFLLVAIICVFQFAVVLAGNAMYDLGMGLYGIVAANIGLGLLGLCFWGIAVALWSFMGGSGPAIGATAAVAVVTYFLNGLGAVVDFLAPFRWISPFFWYLGDTVPLAKGITWGYVALAVVAVAGTAIAVTRFQHRDLAV